MNKVKVSILGKDYVLQTEEKEEYARSLAKAVDRSIKEIMNVDPSLSITSACILASIDAIDNRLKMETECDNLRFQLKDYINEAKTASTKAEAALRRCEKLESENKELINRIELYTLQAKLNGQE